jgi:uncharacterized repeat protein (TIGR03843 family)
VATVVLLVPGELTALGRIMPASNSTFFCRLGPEENDVRAVYKPVSGERPLWDFAEGTLAAREYAAWLVSEALGWDVVPPTVLRADGPAGVGMVQAWREPDVSQDPVDLVPTRAVPEGYLHVLDAYDGRDREVSLVHEDSDPLRRMAVFDIVVNNADRKGGHVLEMVDGHRYGVDHGVTFHTDHKLRTVLWGWLGQPLTDEETAGVRRVREALGGELGQALAEHLTDLEIDVVARRCDRLLATGAMPSPRGQWPAVPWPPF